MLFINSKTNSVNQTNICRATKPEKNDELQHIERQVEKYRDVLQTISKKISINSGVGQDQVAREKRIKKTHEYMLGQAMDDSAKELPDGLFKRILDDCGECVVQFIQPIITQITRNRLDEMGFFFFLYYLCHLRGMISSLFIFLKLSFTQQNLRKQ